MKKLLSFTLVILTLLTLVSCTPGGKNMEGDKNVLERTFDLTEGGAWTLIVDDVKLAVSDVESYIRCGSAYGEALKICTDDNIFTSLEIEFDRELRIVKILGDEQYTYDPSEFQITLGVEFEKLTLNGDFTLDILKESGKKLDLTVNGAANGNIVTEPLDSLTVTVNGAASLDVDGRANNLMIEGNGAMAIDASGCEATVANIKLNGAASAKINVTGELYAEANGTCAITCKGNPEVKSQAVNGLSTLTFE